MESLSSSGAMFATSPHPSLCWPGNRHTQPKLFVVDCKWEKRVGKAPGAGPSCYLCLWREVGILFCLYITGNIIYTHSFMCVLTVWWPAFVCVCMCVSMYLNVHVCLCMKMYMSVFKCVWIFTCILMHICVHLCVDVCLYICACLFMFVPMSMCICVHEYVYACVCECECMQQPTLRASHGSAWLAELWGILPSLAILPASSGGHPYFLSGTRS